MFLLAAISLGFLGSFHCIGMCGPIALTIPVKRNSVFAVISGSLVYNFGRVLTYASMGLLFGLLGKGFALAGWQNILSIVLGVTILLLLFIPDFSLSPVSNRAFMRMLEKVKSKIRMLFGIHTTRSLVFIGLLNGLFLCGLVYLGIVGSISTGDAFKGALFMMAFGLGTLPAMDEKPEVRHHLSVRFREHVRKVIPIFVGVMAVMLILRGMNLGIPYISPSVKTSGTEIPHHECCKKISNN